MRPSASPPRTSESRILVARRDAQAPRSPGSSSEARLRAAPDAGPQSSGQYVMRYALVREILLRYLSPILVDSVLKKAMADRNVTPAMLSHATLSEITGDIMIGLRLFVGDERLPQLMLDLAEVLEGEDP